MDEESLDLVKAAAEGGAGGFVKAVAPWLVEAGEWGADLIRRRRMSTQLKTLLLAERMLSEAGIAPTAIAMKVFVPLLEHASLEDDVGEAPNPEEAQAMHERWAALLANA